MPPDAPQLTALTLIRIDREDSGYTVVSGSYEAGGRPASLNVSHTKNGDWIAGTCDTLESEDPIPSGEHIPDCCLLGVVQ